MVTPELIRELFNYVDGNLYWKHPRVGVRKNKPAGTIHNGYMRITSKLLPHSISVNRAVWMFFNGDIPEGMVIDHMDRVKLNDRIENLRCVTNAENLANTMGKRNKASGLPRGVYRCTCQGKYRFSVMRNGEVNCRRSLTFDEAVKLASEFFNTDELFVGEITQENET